MEIKVKEGLIFCIPLNNGRYAFGKVLEGTWAFFDFVSNTREIEIKNLSSKRFVFKLWVSKFALSKGIWEIIGNSPLTESEKQTQYFYKQDKINQKVWKTITGAEEIPTTVEECQELELAAVYDPEHVVERLEYYFSEEPDPNLEFDRKSLIEKGVSTINKKDRHLQT